MYQPRMACRQCTVDVGIVGASTVRIPEDRRPRPMVTSSSTELKARLRVRTHLRAELPLSRSDRAKFQHDFVG